jgi:hypothetical protein
MKSARRNKIRSPLSRDLALCAVRFLDAGAVGGGVAGCERPRPTCDAGRLAMKPTQTYLVVPNYYK